MTDTDAKIMREKNEAWEPKAGDRVYLIPNESWILPYRKFAIEMRPATVIRYTPSVYHPLLIAFDVKRKGAKPQTLYCHPCDVECPEVLDV